MTVVGADEGIEVQMSQVNARNGKNSLLLN